MLIIAIPKSGSTSLMATLGRLHNLPAEQMHMSRFEPSEDFRLLSDIHDDQAELDPALVGRLTSNDRFYKQHILPTANNRRLLHGRLKVILLRRPEDIVLSYRRAVKAGMAYMPTKGTGRVRQLMDGSRTEADWLDRAQRIGLLDELSRFYRGWAESDDEQLIVHYDDLVKGPGAVINHIEDYLGLPRSHEVALSKERYSRSVSQNLRRKAGRTPLLRWLKYQVTMNGRQNS